MNITEAVIYWTTDVESDHPEIKIYHRNVIKSQSVQHLTKSVGACFLGWKDADRIKLAGALLAIYNNAVCSGIPVDMVEDEFMRISEYSEWKLRNTGPFADLYWSWQDPKLMALARAETERKAGRAA